MWAMSSSFGGCITHYVSWGLFVGRPQPTNSVIWSDIDKVIVRLLPKINSC